MHEKGNSVRLVQELRIIDEGLQEIRQKLMGSFCYESKRSAQHLFCMENLTNLYVDHSLNSSIVFVRSVFGLWNRLFSRTDWFYILFLLN